MTTQAKAKAKVKLSESLSKEMEKYETTSDKIRFLNSKGIPRGAIADILGKRYQHVRNVLTEDARVGRVFSK